MGILDCGSILFSMTCDIYYATEIQDKYGKMDKTWTVGKSPRCTIYSATNVDITDNFSLNKRFFDLQNILHGRFEKDPRIDDSGAYHQLSHILITNIRNIGCDSTPFFVEANDEYDPQPTIFEVKTCTPQIGPFNNIEYWRIQLERSDSQEFDDNGIS